MIDLEKVKSYAATILGAADGQKLDGAGLGVKLSQKFKSGGLVSALVRDGFIRTDETGSGNHAYYLSSDDKDSTSTVHRPASMVVRKPPNKNIVVAADRPSGLQDTAIKGLQAQIDVLVHQNQELLKRIVALEASSSSSGGASSDA